MKTSIPIFLLIAIACPMFGQTNYAEAIQQGDKAFSLGQYKEAIHLYFVAADFDPSNIKEVQKKAGTVMEKLDSLQRETQKDLAHYKNSHTAYLSTQAQQALAKEDIRLAWNLIEAILQSNPDDQETAQWQKNIPAYCAEIFTDGVSITINQDSNAIVIGTFEADGSITGHLIDLKGQWASRIIPNIIMTEYYYFENPFFSADNKYLIFFTKKPNEPLYTLNVLDVNEPGKAPRQFPNQLHQQVEEIPDIKHLVFISKAEDETFILNLLDLKKNEAPHQFLRYSVKEDEVFFARRPLSQNKQYLAFQTLEADQTYTLNVVDIKNNYARRRYPNVFHKNDFSFNPFEFAPVGNHFIFFTLGLDKSINLNILDLDSQAAPKIFNEIAYDGFSEDYGFSPDGQFLTFHTNQKDKSVQLNVLSLKKDQTLRQFPDVYEYYYEYSPNSRYLSFFSSDKDDRGFINILDLTANNTTLKQFPVHTNACDASFQGIYFSPDQRFLYFFNTEDDQVSYLNLIDLNKQGWIRKFPNANSNTNCYFIDDRHIVFFTLESDESTSLNLLDLSVENASPAIYANIETERYCFCDCSNSVYTAFHSLDKRFLVFLTKAEAESVNLQIIDLKKEIPPREFSNIFNYINCMSFSPDGGSLAFLTIEKNNKIAFNTVDFNSNLPPQKLLTDNDKDNTTIFNEQYLGASPYFAFSAKNQTNTALFIIDSNAPISSTILSNGASEVWIKHNNTLFFFTNEPDKSTTLNLINLNDNLSVEKIPNTYWLDHELFLNKSTDGQYITFRNSSKDLVLYDLKKKQLVRTISHYYPLISTFFIKNNYLLSSSQNPLSEKPVYKLFYIPTGSDYFQNYQKKYFSPFTEAEKMRYGIK